jgi:hypothetical protein
MLRDGRFPGLRVTAGCPSFPEHKVPVEFLGNGSPLTVARAAPDLAKYHFSLTAFPLPQPGAPSLETVMRKIKKNKRVPIFLL